LEEPIRQSHNALSLVVFIRLQVTEWSKSWQNAMRELFKGKPQTADVVSISCAKHKSGRYPQQWHFVTSMLKPLNCGQGEY
jgi:hypothetical protein